MAQLVKLLGTVINLDQVVWVQADKPGPGKFTVHFVGGVDLSFAGPVDEILHIAAQARKTEAEA